MKAIWNGIIIAEADRAELILIENNWYFPPSAVNTEYLRTSDTPYVCPWKGACQYFDIVKGKTVSKDNAWSYPDPKASAIEKVGHDFSDYVAFWREVKVT